MVVMNRLLIEGWWVLFSVFSCVCLMLLNRKMFLLNMVCLLIGCRVCVVLV